MYTENKKISNKKYDKLHMKTLQLSMKKEDAEKIKSIADENNMSTSLFCRRCIKYCIDNDVNINDIDI